VPGVSESIRLINPTDETLVGELPWPLVTTPAHRSPEPGTRHLPGRPLPSNSSVRYSTPFGGFKQSALGREHSMHVLDHYSELKNVFIAT
jgi:hypothetical protein